MIAAPTIAAPNQRRQTPLTRCMHRALGIAMALCMGASFADAETDSLGVIHIAYSGRIVTNISKKDAEVAISIWAKQGMESIDIIAQPKIAFYENKRDLQAAIERRELDFLSLSSVEYLQLREHIEPVLLSQIGERPDGRRLLLVHRDRQWKDLEDLRGGHLVAEAGLNGRDSLSLIWLNLELLRAGLYDPQTPFFRRTQTVNKTMPAILPVAFKQADAALVYGPNFATIAELNPQLEHELVALRTSPHMLPVITCIPYYVAATRRQQLIDIMLQIDKTPQGKQIMTLFGIDGVKPFDPELLEPIERLIAERDSLSARLKTRKKTP